jgi:uncharacterized protein (DUF427 family)
VVGGQIVLDTVDARLLHETGLLPVAYAPLSDFDPAALERTATSTHCPFKGDASYWSVRGVEDALWAYEEPLERASWLAGYAALDRSKVDAWFVEDDRLFGPHLRDPYVRVDVHESSRPVVVRAAGTVVARSVRPKLLFETGHPPRAYVPFTDVITGVQLLTSEKRTQCPYKGEASYWHVRTAEGEYPDAAWSYETPLAEVLKIQGHLSFEGKNVSVEVGDPA